MLSKFELNPIEETSLFRGVDRLSLSYFRCYETLQIAPHLHSVVLTGPNGAGKTNILEALSFLIPGRGLRRAKLSEIQKQGSQETWAASYHLRNAGEELQIGTGLDPESQLGERRLTKVNGEKLKSQSALTEWVSVVWLTPQMDRLFLESSQGRRRMLDRLVYGFDPTHAARLSRYEKVLKERSFLLRQGRYDRRWLEGLEDTLVNEGIAIAVARRDIVGHLRNVLNNQDKAFPQAHLSLEGDLETLLQQKSSLEAEEDMRRILAEKREYDKVTGRVSIGPHRSDLCVVYLEKNQPAALCSTGEQKALLLSIIMASAHLLSVRSGAIPILLLDEVVAHLDKARRSALFDGILRLKMQTWLTGTDVALFEELQGRARFFEIEKGRIVS